jgi:hypothetical protein
LRPSEPTYRVEVILNFLLIFSICDSLMKGPAEMSRAAVRAKKPVGVKIKEAKEEKEIKVNPSANTLYFTYFVCAFLKVSLSTAFRVGREIVVRLELLLLL